MTRTRIVAQAFPRASYAARIVYTSSPGPALMPGVPTGCVAFG